MEEEIKTQGSDTEEINTENTQKRQGSDKITRKTHRSDREVIRSHGKTRIFPFLAIDSIFGDFYRGFFRVADTVSAAWHDTAHVTFRISEERGSHMGMLPIAKLLLRLLYRGPFCRKVHMPQSINPNIKGIKFLLKLVEKHRED